jgi:hypothetical protein
MATGRRPPYAGARGLCNRVRGRSRSCPAPRVTRDDARLPSREFLLPPHQQVCLCCSRRVGKPRTTAALAVQTALEAEVPPRPPLRAGGAMGGGI